MYRIASAPGSEKRRDLRFEWVVLRDPWLWLLLGALLLGIVAAARAPQFYLVDIGYEEGYGSDLPILRGFNTAEANDQARYRWSDTGAQIRLPGFGARDLHLRLDLLGMSPEILALGPQTSQLWLGERLLAEIPSSTTPRSHDLLVPAAWLAASNATLTISSTTFTPPGDPRSLGVPFNTLRVAAAAGWPPLGSTALWLSAFVVGYLALRRALHGYPHARRLGATLLGIAAALVALAALLDPPRWAFGAQPALIAAALCYLLALGLHFALPPLARAVQIPLSNAAHGLLCASVTVAFGLRFGGRLFPNSMHGDIGFHTNRFLEAAGGHIFIVSLNRGVEFPYPPGPYLLIAPFILLGIDVPLLLQLGAGLLDSLSGLLVYAMLAATGRVRAATLAAATYLFTAAGLMVSWWSFDTHIYSQAFAVLSLTTISLAAAVWLGERQGRASAWTWAVFGALALVFLGHFGFLINMAAWLSLVCAALIAALLLRRPWARPLLFPLLVAGGGASLFAIAMFYSSYLPIFLGQLATASEGGLSAVAGRAPISRSALWEVTWQAGLIEHFGFFPLFLALLALPTLLNRRLDASGRLGAMGMASFLASALFAVVPFITLASNSTRWLMFSAWAVAIGFALFAGRLWRRGAIARLVLAAIIAYVLWNRATFWFDPMLFRIRPPEPF